MKFKKLLATAMAAVMAVTMIPASVKAATNTIPGGGVYVPTEVYNVELPTTANMKFYLDPQGLTSMKGNNNAVDPNAVGKIVANVESVSATNKSSVPVGLKMSYTVTGGGISVVNSVTDDDANEVAVSITASMGSGFTTGGVWDASGTVNITSPGAIAATPTFAGTAGSPGEATYIMGAADYEMEFKGTTDDDKYDSSKYNYKYKDNTGSEIALAIGGACSKDGDWSRIADGTDTLTLEAVFKFYKVDDSDKTNVALKTDEVDASSTPVTIDADGLLTVTGLTSSANYTGIFTSIKWTDDQGTVYTTAKSNMTYKDVTNWTAADGGWFTAQYNTAWMTYLRDHNVRTVYVTITLTDGSTIQSNVLTL